MKYIADTEEIALLTHILEFVCFLKNNCKQKKEV